MSNPEPPELPAGSDDLVLLLPCPFCGFDENSAPRCANCGACGPDDFDAWGMVGAGDDVPADEYEAWNRRDTRELDTERLKYALLRQGEDTIRRIIEKGGSTRDVLNLLNLPDA